MTKYVTRVLEKYNFTYEKNTGYGFIDNYEVSVINQRMQLGPVFYISTFLSQTLKNEFVKRFTDLQIQLCQATYFDCGVAIMIGAMTGGTFKKKFEEVMTKILEILKDLDAPGKNICPQSGEELTEDNSKIVHIESLNINLRLSNGGAETIEVLLKQDAEAKKNAPNNYLHGFLGILIGAIIGVALTIGFQLIGLISYWTPVVSISVGSYLSKKFGGKQNKVMLLINVLTNVVFIFLGVFISYIIVASIACANAGLLYRGFEAFDYVMTFVDESPALFIRDLVINTFFIIGAEFFVNFLMRSKRVKVK